MLRNLSISIVSAFFIFASSCSSTSRSALPSDAIDGSYSPTGMYWTNGGYIHMAVKAFAVNGKTAVCGAYVIVNTRVGFQANEEVIANGRIFLAEKLILRNLSFFQRLTYEGEKMRLDGKPTNCALTSVNWRPEFATAKPKFDYARRRVEA